MYAGAKTNTSLDAVKKLRRSRYVLQEKMDGAYCEVKTDRNGFAFECLTREGKRRSDWVNSLIQCGQIGAPFSVLVGEITDCTPQSAYDRALFGGYGIHLFDAKMVAGEPIYKRPHRERRDIMYRSVVQLENPRAPVVFQHSIAALGNVWSRVRAGLLEGLVVVDQDAPMGRRNSKRKLKHTDHLDMRVIERHSRTVFAVGGHGTVAITLSDTNHRAQKGDVVRVAYNGWYDSKTPRFARIVDVRGDYGREVHTGLRHTVEAEENHFPQDR